MSSSEQRLAIRCECSDCYDLADPSRSCESSAMACSSSEGEVGDLPVYRDGLRPDSVGPRLLAGCADALGRDRLAAIQSRPSRPPILVKRHWAARRYRVLRVAHRRASTNHRRVPLGLGDSQKRKTSDPRLQHRLARAGEASRSRLDRLDLTREQQ
jgi:hypothetical protein